MAGGSQMRSHHPRGDKRVFSQERSTEVVSAYTGPGGRVEQSSAMLQTELQPFTPSSTRAAGLRAPNRLGGKKISVYDEKRSSRSVLMTSDELRYLMPSPRVRVPAGGFASGGIEEIVRKRNEQSLREESTRVEGGVNLSFSSGLPTDRKRGVFDEQSV